MNKLKLPIIIILLIISIIGIGYLYRKQQTKATDNPNSNTQQNNLNNQINQNPLSIEAMRKKTYPGSDLVIEETLTPGSNYNQYIASYLSDGLKIYGLLTVPTGEKPLNGWPVIIFNHGYIPPQQYKTTERYIAYVDAFARVGYIVFKPDYRGNGNSEGKPEGAYYSPSYAIDVLNAITTLKHYKDADPEKIGMWGHSMGGNITLRNIVVDTKDIKVAVIWGGVVGSYNDLINNWQRRVSYQPPPAEIANRNNYRQQLINQYGTPQTNPNFWNSIDPTFFLNDVNIPIQLHTGGNDEEVPVAFSVNLYNQLIKLGKTAQYYNYPGGDHNISSPNFELAMQRSVDFFNKYLKG
ncbi:MAG: alpha/beta fold hydrolase [Patescibacteria group bacterium]|nr:alpha/beta fold hydrolase [Patescibacteria group bacterium]